MPTSLDQLEQLNALFRPMGESIANYGAMKFKLDQQRLEQARQDAMAAIAAQRQMELETTVQNLRNKGMLDAETARVDAAADRQTKIQDAADAKALNAERYKAFLAYAKAGGKKKPGDFSEGTDGLAEIQQETNNLEDETQKASLAALATRSAGIQQQIDKITSLTDADRNQAAQVAVDSADPTGWFDGSKENAKKVFLADRTAFVHKFGAKATDFINTYDAELARIRQMKVDLNKEAIAPLALQLQNLIKTQGTILERHPDWAVNLMAGPAASTGAPAAPTGDPFAAFLKKTAPAPALPTTSAASPIVVSRPAPVVSAANTSVLAPQTTPAISAAPVIDPNLFRTQAIQRDIQNRMARGQAKPDAFANALLLQQSLDADARQKQAVKEFLSRIVQGRNLFTGEQTSGTGGF